MQQQQQQQKTPPPPPAAAAALNSTIHAGWNKSQQPESLDSQHTHTGSSQRRRTHMSSARPPSASDRAALMRGTREVPPSSCTPARSAEVRLLRASSVVTGSTARAQKSPVHRRADRGNQKPS